MDLCLDYLSLSLLLSKSLTLHTAKMSTRKSGLLIWSTVSYFIETSIIWPKASKIFQKRNQYIYSILYIELTTYFILLNYFWNTKTMLFTCADSSRWRVVSSLLHVRSERFRTECFRPRLNTKKIVKVKI